MLLMFFVLIAVVVCMFIPEMRDCHIARQLDKSYHEKERQKAEAKRKRLALLQYNQTCEQLGVPTITEMEKEWS